MDLEAKQRIGSRAAADSSCNYGRGNNPKRGFWALVSSVLHLLGTVYCGFLTPVVKDSTNVSIRNPSID